MRKNKQGGFTLIEMLIVVAIIAILVAISIPLVNSNLERARESTDMANERAFKAEVLLVYLNGLTGESTADALYNQVVAKSWVYYDAVTGAVVPNASTIKTPYGKNTTADGGTGYAQMDDGKEDHTKMILRGIFDPSTNVFDYQWVLLNAVTTG